jgi:hypothetical protein
VGPNEGSPSVEEQLATERQKNAELQYQYDALSSVSQKLVAAITDAKGILESCLDDPDAQKALGLVEFDDSE